METKVADSEITAIGNLVETVKTLTEIAKALRTRDAEIEEILLTTAQHVSRLATLVEGQEARIAALERRLAL